MDERVKEILGTDIDEVVAQGEKSGSKRKIAVVIIVFVALVVGVLHTRPHSQERTQRLTRANRACFRWGWYPYPQRALRGPEPLRAQRSEEHSLPSLHGPRERRREAESLRNGDAAASPALSLPVLVLHRRASEGCNRCDEGQREKFVVVILFVVRVVAAV